LTVALTAGAAPSSTNDPNDTRGPLDVRRIERIGSEKPRWTIVTFGDWRVARMFDRGYFLVYLDTFGSRRFDYYALVRSKGSGLSGTLWRDRTNRDDVRIGFVESFRRNDRSVAVRVPLRRLHIPPDRFFYFWQVRTLYTGPHCTQVCIDIAPNGRGVFEVIPGGPSPSPTTPLPTITPSPTFTPSPTATP
jgi:hypothetical protein